MSKAVYTVMVVGSGEVVATSAAFEPCRTISRNFLTDPDNFGKRIQVIKDMAEGKENVVKLDLTNIKYSTGKVRMTLYSEFVRQQERQAATDAKAAAKAAEAKAKAEAKAVAKAAKAIAEAETPVAEVAE